MKPLANPSETPTPARVTIAAKSSDKQHALGKAGAEWQFEAAPKDQLAACLAVALSRPGAEVTIRELLEGLPLQRGAGLTPELAVRAAQAHGADARLFRRKIKDIPEPDQPAVLFLSGRDAALLMARQEDGACQVFWPSRSDNPIWVGADELKEAYSGHALCLAPHSAARDREIDAGLEQATGHWFWSHLKRYRAGYAQVILASAIVNILALATPIFTMNVYDRVFPNNALITLWSLVAGVAIALIGDAILKWLRSRIVDRVGAGVDRQVSAGLFRHVAGLRPGQEEMRAGSVANTVKDFDLVREFFSSQTAASVVDLLFSVLFIAVIAYIGGPLALPPALALIVSLVIGLVMLVPLRRAANQARGTGSLKNQTVVEAASEIETLRAVGGQSSMQARWERDVNASAEAQARNKQFATLTTTLVGLAQQASSIGIVVIGVYLALDGRITMGAVIAAMILSGRALAPTATLAGMFIKGSFALAAMRAISQLVSLPSDGAPRVTHSVRAKSGTLKAKDATLRYPDQETDAIRKISLDIPEGSRIGVVGGIGAGKSSLLRLLSGIYPPSDGKVLIDGLHMNHQPASTLRDIVQFVPQDAALFSGTLAENIAFGCPDASDEDILIAARQVGVDQIAAAHPDGFGMLVSERGRSLSGGQRQLVALARALIRKPKVLVMDEPTSAMDNAYERLLMARFAALTSHSRLSIIIATHRTAPLQLVDRLIVMNDGVIQDDGPRAEVLARLDAAGKGAAS